MTNTPEGYPSRRAALTLLSNVVRKARPFDQLLETEPGFLALPPRDRALAHMITATCLRRLGQCDHVIKRFQEKPTSLDPHVEDVLRLGITQILFMAVADHAAVDVSVRLCKEGSAARYKNLVNAMLRRATREQAVLRETLAQSTKRNTPKWLWSQWVKDWGEEITTKIACSNMAEAPLDLRFKTNEDLSEFQKEIKGKTLFEKSYRLTESHPVTTLPGFQDGTWWVQDAAAALPASLLGDVTGARVLDLCAAPGGKTAQLAAAGAQVTALDRSDKRLKRLRENIARLGLSEKVEVVCADGTKWKSPEPYDFVLLDAPCSSTGVIRRHPDIPHLKSPDDIEALAKTQTTLLNHLPNLLKSGGTAIYCTCSTLKTEGENQIEAFLSTHSNFLRKPFKNNTDAVPEEFINEHGDLRLFPFYLQDLGGLDGFFISKLQKK